MIILNKKIIFSCSINKKYKNIKENIIAIPAPLGVGRVWLDLLFGKSKAFIFFKIGIENFTVMEFMIKLKIQVISQIKEVNLINIFFL